MTTSRRVLIATFLVIVFTGSVLLIGEPIRRAYDARHSTCTLTATAAVASRNTPVGRATNWSADMFSLKNGDTADWSDVVISVYGRQPGGPYRRKKDFLRVNELTSFSMNDLAADDGQHWVSLMMTAERVEVKATMLGRACSATVPLS